MKSGPQTSGGLLLPRVETTTMGGDAWDCLGKERAAELFKPEAIKVSSGLPLEPRSEHRTDEYEQRSRGRALPGS